MTTRADQLAKDLTEVGELAGRLLAPERKLKNGELDPRPGPEQVMAKVAEYRRGGLPGASMGNGSKSAETPLPKSDKADDTFRLVRVRYERGISQALKGLRVAMQAHAFFLEIAKDVEKELAPRPCWNINCARMLETGRDNGECNICRSHRSKHGLAWPFEPSVAQ